MLAQHQWQTLIDQANERAGSLALGAEAWTVFGVKPATMEIDNDRLVFDCAKSSNHTPPPASCRHRRNGGFLPEPDFELDAWLNPPGHGGWRVIAGQVIEDIFRRAVPTLTRQELVRL